MAITRIAIWGNGEEYPRAEGDGGELVVLERQVGCPGGGGDPTRSSRGVDSRISFRGTSGAYPVESVGVLGGSKMFVNVLYIQGLPENSLDFDKAAVGELGGIYPGILGDVEALPFLDGVYGFLDLADYFNQKALSPVCQCSRAA